MVNGVYLSSAFLFLVTTQSTLKYSTVLFYIICIQHNSEEIHLKLCIVCYLIFSNNFVGL